MTALYRLRLPLRQRLAIAAEVGADVPFGLFGGTAVGRGRGERLRRIRLERPFRAVIAVPGWRISTARAFDQINQTKYGLTVWAAKLRFAQLLGRERITLSRALRLGNTFEKLLGSRRRDFESLRERLRAAGARQVRMTGSGSAVFGVLAPGIPADAVVGRFAGSEPLYVASSARAALRLRTLP